MLSETEKRVKALIEKCEAQYTTIIDNVKCGVAVYQPIEGGQNFIFRGFNKTAEKIDKINKEDLIGKKVTEAFPSIKDFGLLEVMQKVFQTGEPEDHPIRLYEDNRIKGWRDNYVFKLPTGQIVAIYEDATEKKRSEEEKTKAEEKVKKAAQKYESIFKNMLNGFALHEIILDDKGKPIDYTFLEVNNSFEKITGLKKENILGKKVTEILPGTESDPADWIGKYGEVALTGKEIKFEQFSQAVGKWFSIIAFRPKENQFVTIFEDISERKDSEKQLTDSKNFYEDILTNVQEGIWVTNKEDEITFLNPGMEKIAEISQSEFLGTKISEFPEETIDHFIGFFNKAKNQLIPQEYEAEVTTPAKRKTTQSGWLVPIKKEGKYAGMLCTIQDITKRKKAEGELKESEQKFRTLVENVVDWVWTVDTNGAYIYSSPQVKKIMGYEISEILGKTPFDFMTPKEAKRVGEIFSKIVAKQERIENLEDTMINKNGKQIIFETNATPLFDDKNNFIGYMGTCRDITEKEKANQTIKESEQKFRGIFESAIDLIVLLDDQGTILDMNEQFLKSTGSEKNSILGKKFFEISFLDEKSKQKTIEKFKRRMSGEKVEPYSIKFTSPDNKTRYLEIQASPISLNGTTKGSIAILRDITEREKAKERVKESENKFREISETVFDIIYETNNKGVITSLTGQSQKVFQRSPEEMIGKRFFEFLPPEEIERTKTLFRERLQNPEIERTTIVNFLKKDGSKGIIEINASVTKDNGHPIGMIGAIREVTEKKKAEQQLQKSLEEKDALLQEMHHRIKNNLQVISSIINMQAHATPNQESIDILKACQSRIKTISLIHDKLNPSQNVGKVNLSDYTKKLVQHIFQTMTSKNKNIRYEINIQRDLHLPTETAIPSALIINELVSNSLKHAFPDNRQGRIFIGIQNINNEIKIKVKDTGIGFQNHDKNSKTLGLQLLDTLTKQLGGTINTKNNQGTETTIIFKYKGKSN
jgi:PAS domain S-box-containing protein